MELIGVRPCGYFYGIYCCLLNTAKILRDHLSGNVVMSDSMSEKLAQELMDASRGQGSAVKRREDLHRMAEANRAFVHYKW